MVEDTGHRMGFYEEKINDMVLLSIPSFSESGLVEHGFTCRLGGNSQDPYGSLNMGFHVGDDPAAVLANRRKIAGHFGASVEQMVAGEQVHGKRIHLVTRADLGRGGSELGSAIPATDGLVTNIPGILLSSFYADCVPLYFLDPVHQAVGLAHAGWKGTCQRIGQAALTQMGEAFGTKPEDCLAGIGPSIGPCCFQVEEPVYQSFSREFDFIREISRQDRSGKWMIDLWEVNRRQLTGAGIRPGNITVSALCTYCRQDYFYSYRGDDLPTGRQAAFIMLKRERPAVNERGEEEFGLPEN